MAKSTFPQLLSGASAQFPIKKSTAIRTIKNVLPDGSYIAAPNFESARLTWQLSYVDLSTQDATAIQNHFADCSGPLRAFTFIDPTDNLLASSAEIAAPFWTIPAGIGVLSGIADPLGGKNAFTLTNGNQITTEIGQHLSVPASYQYCLSAYISSASSSSVSLIRRGADDEDGSSCPVGPMWTRVVSSGRLNDETTGLWVAVALAPGQSISFFGPQLDAQVGPSRFRPTYGAGGIYPNAHWAVQELTISAEGPNLFSTSFSIETSFEI